MYLGEQQTARTLNMANRAANAAVGQFCKLLTSQQTSQLTDQQLLHRFLTKQEEVAFAMLVERHGPVVLGVCQSVLRHTQDAEDACQAAFLVLARKANSIRKPSSLAPWLHGVAYRLAKRAKLERNRLRDKPKNERSPANPIDELTGRELSEILHEELLRLPESYRLPLILCYLEGQTQDEAVATVEAEATKAKKREENWLSVRNERLWTGFSHEAGVLVIGPDFRCYDS
jgi:RNA polymerase sigma factor (sigma-70 family)